MKVIIKNKTGLSVSLDNGLGNQRMDYDETNATEAVDMCLKLLVAYGYDIENIADAAIAWGEDNSPNNAD